MFNKSGNICFVIFVFSLGIMSFSANKVLADPSIIRISGSFIHGQSVTISGSGFGTKSPAAPLVWNNHESCTTDSDIVTGGCGYNNEGSNSSAYIKTDRSYGQGTKSARMDYVTGRNSMFPQIGIDIAGGAIEIYESVQTYWTRYAGTDNTRSPVFKWSRGGSYPAYSGIPHFNETIRPTQDGTKGGFDSGIYTNSGTTYWQEEGSNNEFQISDRWNRVEYHYKLSNPAGTASGAYETWVNATKNVNMTGRITRTSTESDKLIDYVITPFDGNDTYGVTNGYYFWMDDFYLDNTLSRVEICSGSTWATRGKCEIQPPTAWDANGQSITITVNQGAIPASANRFLYVVDANGLTNSNGRTVTIGRSSFPLPESPDATVH